MGSGVYLEIGYEVFLAQQVRELLGPALNLDALHPIALGRHAFELPD
jgi:hypothetical protein